MCRSFQWDVPRKHKGRRPGVIRIRWTPLTDFFWCGGAAAQLWAPHKTKLLSLSQRLSPTPLRRNIMLAACVLDLEDNSQLLNIRPINRKNNRFKAMFVFFKMISCGSHLDKGWLQKLTSCRRTFSDYFQRVSLKFVQQFVRNFANSKTKTWYLRNKQRIIIKRVRPFTINSTFADLIGRTQKCESAGPW